MITRSALDAVLDALPRLRLGLIGDLFLDRYLELAPGVVEWSIETGLEAYQIPHVRNSPGALGTVINNLAALGVGNIVPVTVIGDDGHGYDLLRTLRRLPVDTAYILRDEQRLTPTYTKPMRQDESGVWHELNRLDIRTREPLRATTIESLIANLTEVFHSTDGLIVLDQINEDNWGIVAATVREAIQSLCQSDPRKLVFVDSRCHLGCFSFGVLKGNRAELFRAAGETEKGSGELRAKISSALETLTQRTGRPAYCTVGEVGIYVGGAGLPVQLVPGCPVAGPVDIVGAGDAATSGIVSALLCGRTPVEAAAVGNLVASITVQQLGTTGTATPDQVRERWKSLP